MALINCPECNKKISSAAASCPHCGFPMHQPSQSPEQEIFECSECDAVILGPQLKTTGGCYMCGRPVGAGPPKPLSLCPNPDCTARYSTYAMKCPFCGQPRDYKPEPPPCVIEPDPPPRVINVPVGSVGTCSACGSLNTYDVVREEREAGGFFGALGARIGSRVGGHGRFRCNDCGHTWEFGTHMSSAENGRSAIGREPGDPLQFSYLVDHTDGPRTWSSGRHPVRVRRRM